MNKLNPSFYMRRAMRSKTPDEFIKACRGLWWFIDHRMAGMIDNYTKAIYPVGDK